MDAFLQIADGIKKDMGILIERHQRCFFPNWSKLQKEMFDMVNYHLTPGDEVEEELVE